MLAGAAKVDITPPAGVRLGGFAGRYKPSEGIHDNLFARALYLEGQDEAILLITVDILNVPNDAVDAVRGSLSRKLGIPQGAIMLSATHTHSGPSLTPDITSEEESELNIKYTKELPLHLSEVGRMAAESTKEGSMRLGAGRAEITYNRRTEGGITDPEVIALSVEDASGHIFASLTNYACHGVVLGGSNYQISGDFMGQACRAIEKGFGGNHVALYANAATGDLNPITCKGYGCAGTFEDAQRLGLVVANATIQALKSSTSSSRPRIGSASTTVKVAKLKPSLEVAQRLHENQVKVLEQARKEGAKPEALKSLEAALEYTGKNLRLVREMEFPDSDQADLQAIRVGGLALATMPGEPVAKLGLGLKARSPFSPTGMVSYANGYHGYIATREDYEKGGYEVTTTWWNRLAPGTGELLLEADLKLLGELK